MKKSKRKAGLPLALTLGSAALALAVALPFSHGSELLAGYSQIQKKYFPGHNSMSEVLDAAAELNEELAEEGMVLLKNDGKLPLKRGSWVSVFGTHASGLHGGSTGAIAGAIETVPESLEAAGYKVNPTLKAFYEKNGSSGSSGPMSSGGNYTVEPTGFTGIEKASYQTYRDCAVVVLARTGGEGSDVSTNIGEQATEEEIANHKALPDAKFKVYEEDGKTVKKDAQGKDVEVAGKARHALMLTKSERELLAHVKESGFKQIVVAINSSNAMELGELKDDPAINAMIWMGRPGETGVEALGKIISGEVNPSGRLVDEFPRDFTADPTWTAIGDQSQVGNVNHAFTKNGDTYYVNDAVLGKAGDATFTSTDYEEGIYLGYRYYETYYEDLYEKDPAAAEAWYKKHVAFAFGEGLSYTEFDFSIDGIYTDADLKNDIAKTAKTAEEYGFNSEAGSPAKVKKLYIPVTVHNNGNVPGKETVQIYVKAPYTKNGIEKSVHDIVGFAKTDIIPAYSFQKVLVEINVQDFASWDARDANEDGENADYELDKGEYIVRATSSSHVNLSVPAEYREEYDEAYFMLLDNAHLHLDDFTDNELHNLFTTDNGKYEDLGFDGKRIYNSERTEDMMYDFDGDGKGDDAMTTMSRADFDGTFPQAVQKRKIKVKQGDQEIEKEINGLVFTDKVYQLWEDTRTPRLDYHPEKQVDTASDGIRVYQELKDDELAPWYISEAEFAEIANKELWTQAASKETRGEIKVKYDDLIGKDWDDPIYNQILNQLTWEELISLFTESRASTPALAAIGKLSSVDEDGPNNYKNLFQWVDEPTIAATFNTELAEREGEIVGDMALLSERTGWYGPGMDMHHSAFSGRNNEYYSQDGLQGGYIGAAVVRGAQSRGLNAMIKHLAFNDQETNRGGQSNMVWTSEQNIRQYEIKMFQMAIQEGGALAGMSGYGRICGVVNQSNYRLNHNMLQDEWGWKGFMITDGFLGMRWCTTIDIMMRAGFGIVYKTEPWYDMPSGRWNPELRGGLGDVEVPAEYEGDPSTWVDDKGKPVSVKVKSWKESYIQYYYARLNAKSVLYSTVNANGAQNGYSELKFVVDASKLAKGKVGEDYKANIGLQVDADSVVNYTATGLPDGLSINDKGEISGTPTEYGKFNVNVTATIDGWINRSVMFQIEIASAFDFAAGSDDLMALKVGEEMEAQLESDVYTTKDGKYNKVEYSLKAGTLPAGLNIDVEGKISGVPTEAGFFHAVVEIKATKSGGGGGGWNPGGFNFRLGPGGGGGGETTTTVTYEFDLKVEGEPAPVGPTVEEQVAELQAELAALVSKVNTGDAAFSKQIQELQAKIDKLPQTAYDDAALKAEISALKTKVEELEKKAAKSGCGSSIVGGSIVAAAALAGVAALVIHKKKKED